MPWIRGRSRSIRMFVRPWSWRGKRRSGMGTFLCSREGIAASCILGAGFNFPFGCCSCRHGKSASIPPKFSAHMLKHLRTGITTITVYSPIMFTLAGYSQQKSQLLAGINNIGACLCSLVGMVLIDRVGRRWLLWAGAAGLGVCMFLEVSC